MNKDAYISLLLNFVKKQGISIYDYYYQLALKKRNVDEEGIPEFEAYNPFLKEEDYYKLIASKEEDICKYFALAMDKTISLNLGEGLTREDIESVISEKLNEDDDSLTRGDIESIISEKMNQNNDSLTREDIESVISEKLNEEDDLLTRGDIESIISHKLDDESLTRGDILNIINESMSQNEIGDARVEYTSEEEGSTVRNFITTIGSKIASFLNGLAVKKNDNQNTTDIYYYDAKENQITDKRSYNSDVINASNGIYVNYQEYIDRMFESILDQYPDADSITFINDDGEEKAFAEVVEEAFQMLREAGSLRFSEKLAENQPKSYQEYYDMNVEGTTKFGNHELGNGIYVKRDLLTDFFSHYYVRALYYEYYDEEELENVK